MKPVLWGVISTARIGTAKVLPAMRGARNSVLHAIGSRNLDSARKAAAELGIAKAYGSYDELLADPDIEAVYNPLPNHLHVPLTLAALKAGKHVLCEKPMSLNAVELDVLREFADRLHIREAFMVRHHPQWVQARALVLGGAIGELRSAQMAFAYFNDDPANIRNQADIGGGGLYDIGCYAVAAGRWFFGAEPQRVCALMDRDPVLRTDRTTGGLLDFGAGRQMNFVVSTQLHPYQRLQLMGTKGRIEIEIPVNAPPDKGCVYHVTDASGTRSVTLPPVDQYTLQVSDFARAIREDKPDARGLDEALAQMRVLDALFASARSQRFERV